MEEAYRVRDSEYIVAVINGDANWSDTPCSSSAKHTINKNMLVAHVENFGNITKYSSTLHIGLDKVLAHYACKFQFALSLSVIIHF